MKGVKVAKKSSKSGRLRDLSNEEGGDTCNFYGEDDADMKENFPTYNHRMLD